MQQYFGGVLAASRTVGGEDDSAIVFTSILSTMSSSQIKLHYVLYSALRKRWAGSARNLGDDQARNRVRTVVPYDEIRKALGPLYLADLENGMFGLYRLGLVANFKYGDFMQAGPHSIEQYLMFEPTILGCNLFLAANGQSVQSSGILLPGLPIKNFTSVQLDRAFGVGEIKTIDITELAKARSVPPNPDAQ